MVSVYFRQLGGTGIETSVIGFGASALGNVFGEVSGQSSDRAVGEAISSGINIFDVSPYYGLTLAEERLGQALQGRRANIYLATKCGRYGAEEFDFSARTITERFEASLRRLKTDHVDILQAHDVEFCSTQKLLTETLPAMARLKAQGKVRFIGATSYWPALLARVIEQYDVDCVLNYCHANLFANTMSAHLLPSAQALGVGVFNASPLHMGLLSDNPVPEWHPAPSAVRQAAIQVRSLCVTYGFDPAMLGLRFSLEMPEVASTFIGMCSPKEVETAVAALETAIPDTLLSAVSAVLAPVHNLSWPSGLAENQDEFAPVEEVIHAAH